MITNETDFHNWLNTQLDIDIPDSIIAFSINIYESPFRIEIVGSTECDKTNEDWACNEDWVSENRTIEVSKVIYGESLQKALERIFAMAASFLQSDFPNAEKLKDVNCFAVGFVDGNLEYVI